MPNNGRVSMTYRDTPGENREFDRRASRLESQGFRISEMVALPIRKGETLRSPVRWRYTFELRPEEQLYPDRQRVCPR